jgi:hypothetical protein
MKYLKGCDTCGDTYKERNKSRDLARQQAKQKSIEEQKLYTVCQEGADFFASPFEVAQNYFRIVEVVSGLQSTSG